MSRDVKHSKAHTQNSRYPSAYLTPSRALAQGLSMQPFLESSLALCNQQHGCEKSGIQKRNDNGDFRSVEVLAVAPDFEGSV